MTAEYELLHLIDALDEDAAGELLDYSQLLAADEDEPLTEDEFARVRAGEAAIAAGDFVNLKDLRPRDPIADCSARYTSG